MTKTAEEDTDFSDGYQNLDCSNVTIKILTNSVETTDLSIINIFARAQMHELFKAVETARVSPRGKKAARLEYYEYRKAAQIESLHSKISIIGDRAIIGSANADVRSFMMDTNNGILVEKATQFVSSYSQFMESLLKNNQLVERVDLGWRNWKSHESDGLDKEITILFDRIAKVLENRKWATKERLDRAKASFMKHMIGETREATKAMTTMFTNIEPELEREIESSASGRLGDPLSRYLKKLKELRENKRSFDEAHKVL
jgi:phosphatidylserine/phosphatidylglycerophosphate/cardiolipin synthase-like enzyme